ncbi:uncharacterized protein GO595_001336 [Histomonas meleagridis]|uniref:uncharacterized protein n=1 Tax=Histomonas meleagridis TaxID=135588 RepID=UPI003559B759|nr:hypothetical protein GO595_001336 [Histomonas meleagridis]
MTAPFERPLPDCCDAVGATVMKLWMKLEVGCEDDERIVVVYEVGGDVREVGANHSRVNELWRYGDE